MTFSTKIFGAVAATTLAFGAAGTAQAAHVINFDGQTGSYFNNGIAAGAFTDTYTFSVSLPGDLFSTVSSINSGNMTNIDFTSVTLNGVAFDILTTGAVEFRQIMNLAAGSNPQTLIVSGISGGNGSYAGTLAFAAVPEPATWAFMIFGFGLVGAGMRSRKVSTKVSYA